jgi:hypothetical protein
MILVSFLLQLAISKKRTEVVSGYNLLPPL